MKDQLTTAQKQIIWRAQKETDNRVFTFGIQERTIDKLEEAGLIEKQLFLKDSEERYGLTAQIRILVEGAHTELTEGHWLNALSTLKAAYNLQGKLNRKEWFLTEKGKFLLL